MIWNAQFCPICNFSNLFPPKWLKMTRNDQFCLICNFSNHFPPKWLKMTRNDQFCLICNFSNLFPLKWFKMTHNGQLFQKGGLDWLQTANFGHSPGFSIFSPKMRLRLTWNGQCHPIHNFSHLLPPKHLIFGEISKFLFLGVGVH